MTADENFADLFAPDPVEHAAASLAEPWKVLLVDDEPDVHAALRLALQDARIEGRPLQLLDARSAAEARMRIAAEPDIALLLLDVVMESEHAGLDLVRYIRQELGNHSVQIIILTGQPGYAPQRQVVTDYEIDGYRLKSELSADKIFVAVYSALRTHRIVSELDRKTVAVQAALAEARRFRHAMDHAPSCIYLKNRELRYVYANQPMLGLLRIGPDELERFEDPAAFPPDVVTRIRAADARVLAGQSIEQEVEFPGADGERRVYWEVRVPVYADGCRTTVWGLCGVATDITDRKRAEEELARHRTRLEELVALRTVDLDRSNARLADTQFAMDRVGIGVAWSDATTGRFLYVNDEACRQLGYTRDELLARSIGDIAPAVTLQTLQAQAAAMRLHGGSMRIEAEHLRKDGTRFPAEVTAHLHRRPGHEWFIAFHTDISQRKAFEDELIHARDVAESASRAKTTFLANMSHELRTPMSAIMGLTGLALRRARDPKLRDQLSTIDQASHHLLDIINNILDISKVEADRLQLEQVDFRLAEMLENLVSMVRTKVAEKGLRLMVDLAPGLPDAVFVGDPFRLGQLLLNLVGNAVKFTARGSVTVRAGVVSETASDIVLRWAVQDTGIGISDEDQQRLFTAFEQADGSMTRKYGGTGLGLAISKRLAQLMGGTIGVDSAPGKGSTFWFTVKLGKAGDAASRLPETRSAMGAGLRGHVARGAALADLRQRFSGARVLLAEDEPVNREVSSELLREAGLALDLAEDGAMALQLARARRYDLILLDVQMPNLNGLDATRDIRAGSLNAETPILAMTANAFEEDRRACFAAGMNDHVSKPVDPGALYQTLLTWLERQPDRPPPRASADGAHKGTALHDGQNAASGAAHRPLDATTVGSGRG